MHCLSHTNCSTNMKYLFPPLISYMYVTYCFVLQYALLYVSKIVAMSVIADCPHNKDGSAILIRNDLKVKNASVRAEGNVELITVVMHGVAIRSVYKLRYENFTIPALGHGNMSHIVIGDLKQYFMEISQMTMESRSENGLCHTISH